METDLLRNLGRLVDRVVTSGDREGFLAECLDTLVETLGAERALVLETQPGQVATVLSARGPSRDLTVAEREEISKTIVRTALETGEHVVWRADLRGQTASMIALTITAAIAAPLRAVAWRSGEEGPRGVLYVDYRDMDIHLGPPEIELFRAAASLVSVVLEMSRRLELAKEELRLAQARQDDEPRLPTLDELLWPASMKPLRREVESSLYSDASILVLGESGTGKTLLARAVAEASGRKPVVRAVLGTSNDLNTITSELFGHERGAFSGAVSRRVGLVELAAGGTLILDEILNLPPNAQQLLLDFTQFGSYRPLGYEGVDPKRVKLRLIAVTNGDLEAAVTAGKFRLDLYHRLAAVVLRLPPLRERLADVPWLVEAHLERMDPGRGWQLDVPLRRRLVAEDEWPGNVRQLESLVNRARERALARDPRTTRLELEDFQLAPAAAHAEEPVVETGDIGERWKRWLGERDALEDRERAIYLAALAGSDGNLSGAARKLGLPRSTVVSRLQALGVDPRRT